MDGLCARDMRGCARTKIPCNDGGIVEIYHDVDEQATETVTAVGWGRDRKRILGKGTPQAVYTPSI